MNGISRRGSSSLFPVLSTSLYFFVLFCRGKSSSANLVSSSLEFSNSWFRTSWKNKDTFQNIFSFISLQIFHTSFVIFGSDLDILIIVSCIYLWSDKTVMSAIHLKGKFDLARKSKEQKKKYFKPKHFFISDFKCKCKYYLVSIKLY